MATLITALCSFSTDLEKRVHYKSILQLHGEQEVNCGGSLKVGDETFCLFKEIQIVRTALLDSIAPVKTLLSAITQENVYPWNCCTLK